MSTIRIVDYDLLEESGEQASPSSTEPGLDRWASLHNAFSEVLGRHGTVGSSERVDYYHSGDWFQEDVDAFSLMSGAGVTNRCLHELHKALIRYDPAATLILEADPNSPLWGLEIYIRASSIDIGWYESDAETCRRFLREHGLDLGAK